MSKVVYLVGTGEYEEYHIISAHLTKEGAEAEVNRLIDEAMAKSVEYGMTLDPLQPDKWSSRERWSVYVGRLRNPNRESYEYIWDIEEVPLSD